MAMTFNCRSFAVFPAIFALTTVSALAQDTAEIDKTTQQAEARQGDLQVSLYFEPAREEGNRTPVFEIRVGESLVRTFKAEDISRFGGFAKARILELDPSNDTPEVLLGVFWGGTHCCFVYSVADKTKNGWQILEYGLVDGDRDIVEDADKDGRPELVAQDYRFLGQAGNGFAHGSWGYGPLQIRSVQQGKLKDVSRQPRFKRRHRAWLKEMTESEWPDETSFVVGVLATRIVMGETQKGIRDFKAALKAKGLETIAACPDLTFQCRDDKKKPQPFFAVARKVLGELGYGF